MKYAIVLLLLSLQVFADEKPSWINNAQEGCKKLSELCTVGMGASREEAQRSAKIEMAKIFSTNISSSFTSSLAAGSGRTSEEIQEEIKEDTQKVLEGVQITKVHEVPEAFYVLATLDKRVTTEGLKIKITDLDNEIKTVFNDVNESSKIKLKQLFVKRQALNQTYLFLAGFEIPSPIASDLIFKKNIAAMKNVVVMVSFIEKDPKFLEALVIKSLSDMGYKVISINEKSVIPTHVVNGKVVAEKQYLNIKGFRKYKVLVQITAMNSKKIETGHLNLDALTTGRTYSHAYENAMKEISNELKEKIADLNLE